MSAVNNLSYQLLYIFFTIPEIYSYLSYHHIFMFRLTRWFELTWAIWRINKKT